MSRMASLHLTSARPGNSVRRQLQIENSTEPKLYFISSSYENVVGNFSLKQSSREALRGLKFHFNVLNMAPSPITSHAYASLGAILFGGLQLMLPKGTKSHRYIGYTWVGLMLWVSISSFWIQTIKIIGPFSPIHFLSVFTIWTIFEAIRSVRNGDVKRHKHMLKSLYALALILTGLFTRLPGRIMNMVPFGP